MSPSPFALTSRGLPGWLAGAASAQSSDAPPKYVCPSGCAPFSDPCAGLCLCPGATDHGSGKLWGFTRILNLATTGWARGGQAAGHPLSTTSGAMIHDPHHAAHIQHVCMRPRLTQWHCMSLFSRQRMGDAQERRRPDPDVPRHGRRLQLGLRPHECACRWPTVWGSVWNSARPAPLHRAASVCPYVRPGMYGPPGSDPRSTLASLQGGMTTCRYKMEPGFHDPSLSIYTQAQATCSWSSESSDGSLADGDGPSDPGTATMDSKP